MWQLVFNPGFGFRVEGGVAKAVLGDAAGAAMPQPPWQPCAPGTTRLCLAPTLSGQAGFSGPEVPGEESSDHAPAAGASQTRGGQ